MELHFNESDLVVGNLSGGLIPRRTPPGSAYVRVGPIKYAAESAKFISSRNKKVRCGLGGLLSENLLIKGLNLEFSYQVWKLISSNSMISPDSSSFQ